MKEVIEERIKLKKQAAQRFNLKGIDMEYPMTVDECFKKE